MNVAKRHIEGATKILGHAGATPTRAIAIPLLPAQGSWVITGTVQAVRADGVHLTCEPATVLPLAQRYFLY